MSPQLELLLNELNAPELTSPCELCENWALLSFRAHSPLSKQPWLLEINLHSSSPCFHPNPWLLNSHARGNSLKDLHFLIGLVFVCFNHHSNASPKEIVLLQIYCTKGLWWLQNSFNCWLQSMLLLVHVFSCMVLRVQDVKREKLQKRNKYWFCLYTNRDPNVDPHPFRSSKCEFLERYHIRSFFAILKRKNG